MRNRRPLGALTLGRDMHTSGRGGRTIWPAPRQAGVTLLQDLASGDQRRLAADKHRPTEPAR